MALPVAAQRVRRTAPRLKPLPERVMGEGRLEGAGVGSLGSAPPETLGHAWTLAGRKATGPPKCPRGGFNERVQANDPTI